MEDVRKMVHRFRLRRGLVGHVTRASLAQACVEEGWELFEEDELEHPAYCARCDGQCTIFLRPDWNVRHLAHEAFHALCGDQREHLVIMSYSDTAKTEPERMAQRFADIICEVGA